jgi:hypothetical protein
MNPILYGHCIRVLAAASLLVASLGLLMTVACAPTAGSSMAEGPDGSLANSITRLTMSQVKSHDLQGRGLLM